MKHTASAVFQHSGIEIRWLACPAATEDGSGILMSVVNAAAQGSSQALGRTTLNASVVVTVFFSQASYLAGCGGIALRVGQLMGYSAAHELGHALLRSGKHALFGVMKGNYSVRELVKMSQANLFFTSQETRLLQRDFGDGNRQLGSAISVTVVAHR